MDIHEAGGHTKRNNYARQNKNILNGVVESCNRYVRTETLSKGNVGAYAFSHAQKSSPSLVVPDIEPKDTKWTAWHQTYMTLDSNPWRSINPHSPDGQRHRRTNQPLPETTPKSPQG
jgi:hypothetical protein